MSIDMLLASGRAAAEALMQDTCTVRRKTSEVTDLFSGTITPVYTDIYTGKCRVQQRTQGQARPEDAGEAFVLMLQLELQLPMSATGLQVDDLVTITASVHDADLPGRVFYVRDLAHKTHATARRVTIQERTS